MLHCNFSFSTFFTLRNKRVRLQTGTLQRRGPNVASQLSNVAAQLLECCAATCTATFHMLHRSFHRNFSNVGLKLFKCCTATAHFPCFLQWKINGYVCKRVRCSVGDQQLHRSFQKLHRNFEKLHLNFSKCWFTQVLVYKFLRKYC